VILTSASAMTELVVSGQRLWTVDEKTFVLSRRHLDSSDENDEKEYVVLHDCHMMLKPVAKSKTQTVKAYESNTNNLLLLCVGGKVVVTEDVAYQYLIPTQRHFKRKIFVVNSHPYYVSTGTSNAHSINNFPNVAFPFKGLDMRGWFIKCYSTLHDEWLKTLLIQFPSEQNHLFFMRFENFAQLKVSALVKDTCDEAEISYWDNVRPLYRFVLRHTWDEDSKSYKKTKMEFARKPLTHVEPATPLYNLVSYIVDINSWLSLHMHKDLNKI